MPYCPNCRTKIGEGTQFCPKCGRGLTTKQSANRMSKKKKAGIIIGSIIGIPMLIIIIVAIVQVITAPTYTLSISVSPSEAGSIFPSGGEYESSVQVTLTASPTSGYTFDHWSGSASGTTSTITITMDSDKSLTANFKTVSTVHEVLFSDDFSNEAGVWDTYSAEYGSVFYKDGWLHLTHNTGGQFATGTYAHQHFTDFILEVETTLVAGTDDNWHMVQCRYQDSSNYYRFGISADGYYFISKLVNGNQVSLASATYSSYISQGVGAVNLIHIECISSNLSLSVNGHLLKQVTDTAISAGDIVLVADALAGTYTEVAFDNIVLLAVFGGDGGGIPSAPTGVTATAGDGQATISWSSVTGATSYNIYWSTTSGVTKTSGTKITGATSPHSHTGLTNGMTYYYLVTAVNSSGESVESAQVSATPTSGAYSGGTIRIQSDDQFTAANGVVSGSGTEADPYVIEGWTIDASSCDTSVWPYIKVGIAIGFTSKYFVIRNCQVENAEEYGYGISFGFLSNGRVEDCVLRNSGMGIGLEGCSNVAISGNTVENCREGISGGGYFSDGVTISNNTITGCEDGISFSALENSSAVGNTISNCGNGICASGLWSGGCTISNNVIHGNTLAGIELSSDSDNNTISGNDVSNNDGTGIEVYSSHNTISHNTANGNTGTGILLNFTGLTDITASYNTVSDNTANNNVGGGLFVGYGCVHNTISSNTANNNVGNGIEVDGDYNTISSNTAFSNNALGKYDPDGNLWYYDIMILSRPNTNTLEGNSYGTIYIW